MADEPTGDPKGPQLNHTQTVNRQREITSELNRLGDIDAPTEDDERYFGELDAEFFRLDTWRKSLERQARLQAVRDIAEGDLKTAPARLGRTPGRMEAGTPFGDDGDMDRDPLADPRDIGSHGRYRNPWKLDEMRTFGREPAQVTAEYRARALSAIEKMPGATDKIRAAATDIIERWDDEDGRLSRLALTLSEPTYLRAWSKMARQPLSPNLDVDEQTAVSRVQASARALSLTDSASGFLVPFQLDPTVIITANGSVNQIRQVARQVVATGDVWHGVSAGAVSWSYDSEATQVSDDSPTFAQPTVPVHKAAGFVPISMEALMDAANITQEVGRLLSFGKDVLEANAFALGTGSGQPTGIVTALVAASPSVIVPSADADTIALEDIYSVQGALPARYRSQPSTAWLANNLTYNALRQLDGSANQGIWSQLEAGRPAMLLGRTALESEDMDGTVTGGADNYLAVFGDFSNFVVADRLGMTVEFIPHLFGANQRPTGQRGWVAYVRHGSDSVNDGAFRLYNCT